MINEKSILAIIPARGGSKGVLNKNIKDLNGLPLIGYTVNSAKQSKYIDRVVVSTDSEKIADISLSFNAEIPYLRPDELATDTSSTVDAILHLVNYLKAQGENLPQYICLLQCTSPFRTTQDIDKAIELLFENQSFDGVVSVEETDDNPYWSNVIEKNGNLKYFIPEGKNITRRQDLPKVYKNNGAVYLIKTEVFLKEKTFETENIMAYIMGKENSIDIDTNLDFKFAEFLMKEKK